MQKLNLHYLHINCTHLKSIEIEAQCLTELLVCLLSVSSSCLSDPFFHRPTIWHNLRKRIIYSWSVPSCQRASDPGGQGEGSEGPMLVPQMCVWSSFSNETCHCDCLYFTAKGWEISTMLTAIKMCHEATWRYCKSMSIHLIAHYENLSVA